MRIRFSLDDVVFVSILATVVTYAFLLLVLDFYLMRTYSVARVVSTAVLGVGMLGLLGLNRGKLSLSRTNSPIVFLYLMVLSCGAINGILSENPLVYVLPNSIYLILQVGGILVGRSREINVGFERIFNHYSKILALMLGLLGFVGVFIPHEIRPSILASLLWGLVSHRPVIVFFNLFALAGGANNLTRSFVLQLLAISPLYLLALRRLPQKLVVWISIVVVTISAFILAYQAGGFEGTQLERRVNETFFELRDSKRTIPVDQRLYEARVAIDEFGDAEWWRWLIGFGTGATLDMSGSDDISVQNSQISSIRNTHNIHLLPVACLYRYGIVGILWLFVLASVAGWESIVWAFRAGSRNDADANRAAACWLYVLVNIMDGMFASSHLLANVWVGIFMGVAMSSSNASLSSGLRERSEGMES